MLNFQRKLLVPYVGNNVISLTSLNMPNGPRSRKDEEDIKAVVETRPCY